MLKFNYLPMNIINKTSWITLRFKGLIKSDQVDKLGGPDEEAKVCSNLCRL